ncbi:MAG: MFS transporter [Candidatus Hodarchaeales archaeon]
MNQQINNNSNVQQRSNLFYILLIGLGFMTTGISWSMYNSYVPYMLQKTWFYKDTVYLGLLPSLAIIGFIMTLDNWVAWIVQPWIGAHSDNTWSEKFGRRMPYILVGVPIAVVAFVAIPLVWWFMPGAEFPAGIIPLFAFMIAINIFNVAMASYRSPVVALMPDLIPAEDRSVANGAINLMGALGSVIAFAGGKLVVGIGRGIGKTMGSTDGDEMGFLFGFGMTGIVMILSLIVLYFAIKEPKTPFGRELEEKVSLKGSFHEVFSNPDKSGVFMLLAIFLWFCGYQALETFFSLYGVYTLGIANVEDAAFYLTLFALPFIIFAIPAGFIANRIGRGNTIKIGLIGMLTFLAVLAFLPMRTMAATDNGTAMLVLMVCLVGAGSFWALINVNSIVIIWEIGKEKRGAYTGMYYFFSMAAAILGPPVVGVLLFIFKPVVGAVNEIDSLFLVSIVFVFLALLCMFGVKSGERTVEK